jgi:ribose-phosphate pyrophosphokinase
MARDHSTSRSDLILGFPGYADPARRLAQAAGLPFAELEIHRFPDGESRVRLPQPLPSRVLFYCSLDHPNPKLLELALAAVAAREQGAGTITLVAPYLCYMRQDKAFHAGEAVSQHIVGGLLAQWFDEVLTVDPHLHRVHDLSQAVPARRAVALSATNPIADFLAQGCDNPLLIGPDEESEQWVASVAARQGLDYRVGRKQRLGDAQVEISLPPAGYAGRNLVLLDDMASTGRTLETAARVLGAQAPASISVVVTHALFVNDALERLKGAGVGQIWSTDSIPHPTNAIPLAPLLAEAL